MALFSKKNLNKNPFGISKKDMIDDIEGYPVGLVVRMMEEQELQGNEPDVTVFQKDYAAPISVGGFDWDYTKDEFDFWNSVLPDEDEDYPEDCFKKFFEKYPDYKKYNQ